MKDGECCGIYSRSDPNVTLYLAAVVSTEKSQN